MPMRSGGCWRALPGEYVPWGLAEAVHRQTEGNPLFVQEVVRLSGRRRIDDTEKRDAGEGKRKPRWR